MATNPATISNLVMETAIDGDCAAVWDALTERIGAWWPAAFYTGGTADTRSFFLEAEPGGRMAERWDDGGGVLWGTVIAVDPERKLQVHCSLFPGWGGPAECFGTWELSEHNGGTLLRYQESSIGADTAMDDKEQGWRFLWDCLKAHVEGEAPPVWQD